ncbi:hypothetical protein [Bauldia sp.]|uniref:hypothetical protein n=1 Tax=Bauldia sp. TaxID=2575872 RepID=UPI003BA908C9
MSQREDPYFDERGTQPPNRDSDEDWPDQDQRWARRERPSQERPPRRPSALRRILTILLAIVIILVVVAGGGYLAIMLGWIDGTRLGLGGSIISPSRPTQNAEVIFSGDAGALSAADGNIIQEDTSVSPPVVWLRSSRTSASPAGVTEGVSLEVPASLLPRIEGRAVRVTISARTGSRDEPTPFAAAFSAGDRGNSGWIVFVPSRTLDDYSFNFRVPIGEVGDPDSANYIGIWSDITGSNAPLAIDRITITPQ